MALDRNSTLTHVYGVLATVIGVVGGISLFTAAATWRDYLLYFSGWAGALILTAILARAVEQARKDGIELGALRSEVNALRSALDQRSAVLDYLGSQMIGVRATPRVVNSKDAKEDT